jgi:hypothetical protein
MTALRFQDQKKNDDYLMTALRFQDQKKMMCRETLKAPYVLSRLASVSQLGRNFLKSKIWIGVGLDDFIYMIYNNLCRQISMAVSVGVAVRPLATLEDGR